MLRIVVAAAALAASATAWAQPCPPIVSKVVTVDGRNDEWTNTKAKVKAGDLVIITATGQVKVGEWTGKVDANGAPDGNGRLDAKTGTGNLMKVGGRWFRTFDEDSGALKVRVNDTHYADNHGSFEVSVIIIPACAVGAPERVEPE